MLRLPDDELSGDRDAVKGQGQAQGVPVTAGDVAAVMVGFMGWINDVSSGDSSSSSSSNSGGASSSAGAGSNDSAREGNTVSKGSGLGPGLSLASTGKGPTTRRLSRTLGVNVAWLYDALQQPDSRLC